MNYTLSFIFVIWLFIAVFAIVELFKNKTDDDHSKIDLYIFAGGAALIAVIMFFVSRMNYFDYQNVMIVVFIVFAVVWAITLAAKSVKSGTESPKDMNAYGIIHTFVLPVLVVLSIGLMYRNKSSKI